MNIVEALKKVKNDLLNFTVTNLNNKADVDHSHSYNDLTDLPIGNVSDDSGALQAFQNKVNSHINDTNIHVVLDDKAKWNNKVDKEDGKGLSSNDFTDDAVNLLSALLEYESYDKNRSENIAHFKKILFEKHKPIYESVVTEPTCSKRGYTTHTCYCGCSYIDSYVDTTEHDWGTYSEYESGWVHECNTCGEKGYAGEVRVTLNYEFAPSAPEGFDTEYRIYVNVLPPDGHEQHLRLSDRYNNVSLVRVPAGQYFVSVDTSQLQQFENYTIETKWAVKNADGSQTEGTTFYLTKENLVPNVILTVRYIPIHDHEYRGVITEPTCTEQGYTTKTCTICGESYKTDYVDPLGHNWGEEVNMGDHYIKECDRCGEQEITGNISFYLELEDGIIPESITRFSVSVVPPDGYKQTIRLTQEYPEVTLTNVTLGEYFFEEQTEKVQADGYTLTTRYVVQYGDGTPFESQTITLTNENPSVTIRIINSYHRHEYIGRVTEPTCTKDGYTTYTCSCGDSYVADYVAALGHDWGETPADGSPRVCNRCGAKDVTTGKLSLYVEFEDGVAPEGVKAFSIDVTYPDGDVETLIVPKQSPQIRLINIPLGQYYINEQTDDIQAEGYTLKTKYIVQCSDEESFEGQSVVINEYNPEATVRIINKYEHIDHAYNSVVTEPTCDTLGYTTHTCGCGHSYVDNYVNALGHDWSEAPADGSPKVCNRCGVQYVDCIMKVNVEFENDFSPLGYGEADIKIIPPDGFSQTFYNIGSGDTYNLKVKMPLGIYTVEELTDKMQVDGYTLTTRYMVQYGEEEPFESQTVRLTAENTRATVTVINSYHHRHEYTSVVTEPTCTERGYTTYTCSCGDSYVADYVDALGHDYGERVEGDYGDVETCNRCGDQIKYFGRLSLYVEFEGDIDTEDLPTSLINVTFPDDGVEGVYITPTRPQMRLIKIPLGQYFIEQGNIEECQIEGYNLEVKYAVSYDGTNYTDAQSAKYTSVMFTDENMIAYVKVIHCYTPIAEE